MNETKKLYRLDHGALAGVCGGVAEYFNVDANLVRLIWVALCFAGTAGLWLYVAAACCCPRRARSTPAGEDNGKSDGAAEGGRRASVIGIRRRH
ncbi:MAG: PspC domain-containing protein [Flavonifractor plautii]